MGGLFAGVRHAPYSDLDRTVVFLTMKDLKGMGELVCRYRAVLDGNPKDVMPKATEYLFVNWMPVWNIFEDNDVPVMLANAQQVKAVPGKKTDRKDAEWLAQLLPEGHISLVSSEIAGTGICAV